MIYFVRFYFMYPISCTRTQKRLTNPETLIKVNIHISGSVEPIGVPNKRDYYYNLQNQNLNGEAKLIYIYNEK